MAIENQSTYGIAFTGDASDVRSVLAALKSQVRSDVAEISALAARVELFSGLEQQAASARTALAAAKVNVEQFTAALAAAKAAGADSTIDLENGLLAAQKAAAVATRELERTDKAVSALDTKLKAAGVDTSRLAAEQIRLADALKVAQDAAALNAAKQALSVKTLADIQPEIAKLTAAYETLKASGTLTASELSVAQQTLATKTAELRGQVVGVSDAIAGQVSGVKSFVSSLKENFLLVGLAIGGVVEAIGHVTEKAREFNDSIARIATVTNLSTSELDKLGGAARDLAKTFGLELNQVTTALFDLLRSGISSDNALTILAESAKAADASLTSINETAKLGKLLIVGYGVPVSELHHAFDVLFQGTKDGGATFAELASSLGSLLPVARSAHVPLDELTAAITVMTRAGVDAPEAIGQLTKIIAKLDTAPAQKSLRALGVEAHGLVETFNQLSSKNLSIDEILALGIGSTKSAVGITALTSATGGLSTELDKIRSGTGGIEQAFAIIEDTAKKRVERFHSAVDDLYISIGNTVGASSGLATIATNVINAVLSFDKSLNETTVHLAELNRQSVLGGGAMQTFIASLAGVTPPAVQASQAIAAARAEFAALGEEAKKSATGLAVAVQAIANAVATDLAKSQATISQLRTTLTGLATDLDAEAKAAEALTASAVADIGTRTAEQLAAVRQAGIARLASESSVAQQSIAIEQQAAGERLAAIRRFTDDSRDAIEAESLARITAAGKDKDAIAKVEADILEIKKKSLNSVVASYKSHLDLLQQLEQGYLSSIRSIQDERLKINESVEDKIRRLERENLSTYKQYQDQIAQIDENTFKARAALLAGNFTDAERYAQKAISEIDAIGKEVKDQTGVIVSAQRARTDAEDAYKKVLDVINATLNARESIEKKGAAATKEAIDEANKGYQTLRERLDAVTKQVAEGVELKIKVKSEAVLTAVDNINKELEDEAHFLKVQLALKPAQEAIQNLLSDLAAGVTANAQAQIDAIAERLHKVAQDSPPEIKLKTDEALGLLEGVRGKVDELGARQITLQVLTNAADAVAKATAKIETLNDLKTRSEHTVYVKTVRLAPGENAPEAPNNAPAPVDDTPLPFAFGGSVPLRGKVPGSGNADTYPAQLEGGAYVLRKAASQYYGDGLLSLFDRGLTTARHFARGGPVFETFKNNLLAVKRPLAALNPGKSLLDPRALAELGSTVSSDPALHGTIAHAEQVLGELISAAKSLPSAQGRGESLADYLAAVLDSIRAAPDNITATSLLQPIIDAFDRYMSSIALARQYNVPIVMGATTVAGKRDKKGNQVPGDGLSDLPDSNPPAPFARGGPSGKDTVPAWLTPGEHVIRPERVSAVGVSFMNALNSMAVPRDALANLLRNGINTSPPARYFAEGGPVDPPVIASGSNIALPANAGATNIVNLNVSVADLYSVENVKRYLMPILDDFSRRTG